MTHLPLEDTFADGAILQSVSNGIGTITINNPAKRNAMSLAMWEGVGAALNAFAPNDAVRVVVITGAGGKAFISGADISQFENIRYDASSTEDYSMRSTASLQVLATYAKPTVSAIRGFCIGGGMQVAMLTDIRIASRDSQFGIPATRLGVSYGYDGLRNLVSLVGASQARLLMFTGMRIDAAEAERIGLIDRLVDPQDLDETVAEIGRTICCNAPLAVAAAKLTIAQILKDPGQRDMAAIKLATDICADSEDFREGRRAFMEKRPPVFRGR